MTVSSPPLVTSARLYSSSSRFVLVPISPSTAPAIEIQRPSGVVTTPSDKSYENDTQEPHEIYGIVGICKLLAGKYLILITGRRLVGTLNGAEIFRMTRTTVLPLQETSTLTGEALLDEKRYKRLLDSILDMDFYLSYQHDITNSFQRLSQLSEADNAKPLYERVDKRFFWNHYLLREITSQQGLNAWALPIMMGFIQINANCNINGKTFTHALISRRNWKRAGTRFNVRGVDSEGNVANNVETEQILLHEDKIACFVQTRGSIPVFWNQLCNLKYTPPIRLSKPESEAGVAFKKHFDEQARLYGRNTMVNLADQKGHELTVVDAYHKFADTLLDPSQFRYIAFDFHRECKKMRYDRLSLLIDQVLPDLQNYGYFYSGKGVTTQHQKGTFRTNCIDNLDRTNVVQTLFARNALERQLKQFDILKDSETLSNHQRFEFVFKDTWANNADAISLQYSGTGALKNDFTRTGKRDWKGALNDGVNSVTRYYLNNFQDGTRQDSFELFLGNFVVETGVSPFVNAKKEKFFLFKIIVLMAIMMLVTSVLAPAGDQTGYKTAVVLFWFVAFFVGYKLILRYGRDLVDKPCLRIEL